MKKDKSIYLIALTNDKRHILKSNDKENRDYNLILFFTMFIKHKDIKEVKDIFKNYLIPCCFDGYTYWDLDDYNPSDIHSEKSQKFIELIRKYN